MLVRRRAARRQLPAEVFLVDGLRPEYPALHLALQPDTFRRRDALLGLLGAPRTILAGIAILLLYEPLLPLCPS